MNIYNIISIVLIIIGLLCILLISNKKQTEHYGIKRWENIVGIGEAILKECRIDDIQCQLDKAGDVNKTLAAAALEEFLLAMKEEGAIDEEEYKAANAGLSGLDEFLISLSNGLFTIMEDLSIIMESTNIIIEYLFDIDLPKLYNVDVSDIKPTIDITIKRLQFIQEKIKDIQNCLLLITKIYKTNIIYTPKMIHFTYNYIHNVWYYIQYAIKYTYIDMYSTNPPLTDIFSKREYTVETSKILSAIKSILAIIIEICSESPQFLDTIYNILVLVNSPSKAFRILGGSFGNLYQNNKSILKNIKLSIETMKLLNGTVTQLYQQAENINISDKIDLNPLKQKKKRNV